MSLQVIHTQAELRRQVARWRGEGLKVGFVPTMGNLHRGHLSLVEVAQETCDRVVVSVFVNPLQFGIGEDYEAYPRTFEQDQQKLITIGADLVFYPSVAEMYPNGMTQTKVCGPELLTLPFEGAKRPGHFDGVTTVVLKLFNMVTPDVVVFGQKDFQQCAVIAQMIDDLCLPIEMRVAPIVREADGLALSSRNQYLSPAQRAIAPKLYQSLQQFAQQLQKGSTQVAALSSECRQTLLAAGFDAVDYIELCDASTLLPILDHQISDKTSFNTQCFVILVVARLGKTRLLDNFLL